MMTVQRGNYSEMVFESIYKTMLNKLLFHPESGQTAKALDACIKAKQWGKAAQIVDGLDDSSLAKQYYGKIADHHASVGDLEVSNRFRNFWKFMQFRIWKVVNFKKPKYAGCMIFFKNLHSFSCKLSTRGIRIESPMIFMRFCNFYTCK